MASLNYLSVSAGTAAAGALAGLYSPAVEAPYFGITGGVAVVIAGLLALIRPWIRQRMAGVD